MYPITVLSSALAPALGLQDVEPSLWRILLDNALPLTVLVIFMAAAVGAIVRVRERDKCLRLFDDYHVSYVTRAGSTIWGDLVVHSQGIELRFDVPHRTRRGIEKRSAMIYERELADCLVLGRVNLALTDDERRARERQVQRSFRPGAARRVLREMRNLFSTLQDALVQALNALMDAVAKARPGGVAARAESRQIGQTLLATAAQAYEPLLERHVGKPVVLRIADPDDAEGRSTELPGYLVDYTAKYLAVFNVDHEPLERFTVTAREPVEREGVRVDLEGRHVRVVCTGPDPLVVVRANFHGRVSRSFDLEVVLLPGSKLELGRAEGEAVEFELQRTQRIDVVCPRSIGTVTFGAETARGRDTGLAPEDPDAARA